MCFHDDCFNLRREGVRKSTVGESVLIPPGAKYGKIAGKRPGHLSGGDGKLAVQLIAGEASAISGRAKFRRPRQDDIRWSPIRTARPKRQVACVASRNWSPHRSPAPRSSWLLH